MGDAGHDDLFKVGHDLANTFALGGRFGRQLAEDFPRGNLGFYWVFADIFQVISHPVYKFVGVLAESFVVDHVAEG